VFKVIDLGPEGKPEESEDPERVRPPPPGTTRWIDVVNADATSLDLLRQRFGFHPLAIEDCSTFEMRSKLDEYKDHLFIVVHTFTQSVDDPANIQVHEVHAFLSPSYLVTVHDNPVPAAERVWRAAVEDPAVMGRGPSWALYLIVDAMVDAAFPMVESLVARVEAVEEAVLSGSGPVELIDVFAVRSSLVTMRRVMRPVRDVVAILSRRLDAPLSERTALHFRDVQDHVLRCLETLEEAEHLVNNVVDAQRYAVVNRTNVIITRLTIFSAIFLPLGFIVGFWGQNFKALPFDDSRVMWALSIGMCGVVPLVLMTWFWAKRWL
jgi:magnesium transporter